MHVVTHCVSTRGGTRRGGAWWTGVAALATLIVLAIAGIGASSAQAAARWALMSAANTTAAPSEQHAYYVTIANVGDRDTNGSVMTFTADMPDGIDALGAASFDFVANWDCSGTTPDRVVCTSSAVLPSAPGFASNTASIQIVAMVDAGASGLQTMEMRVEGGGASAPTESVDPTLVTPDEPGYGIDAFDGQVIADADGTPMTQAGGRPYAITTQIDLNRVTNPSSFVGPLWPVEAPKSISVDLPPGFVGNPTVTNGILCTPGELANTESAQARPLCPPSSQVGVTSVIAVAGAPFPGFFVGPLVMDGIPVFSMVPPPNVPARFGFNVAGTVITLDARLRSGSDYGLTVNVPTIPQALAIAGTTLTFWGVPADPIHDPERACPGQIQPLWGGESCTTDLPRKPLLRNPTSCSAAGQPTVLRTNSWKRPGDFVTASFDSHLPLGYPWPRDQWGPRQGPTGCDRVPFDPTLRAAPGVGAKAGEPSGFTFDLTVPQSENPTAIATSDLRKAVVTLPEGVRVSPSSAGGLAGCSSAQIALNSDAAPTCPPGSKIGNLTIDTPLLDEQLTGAVYLAAPFDNQFRSLVAIYMVARGPGLIVKLPGRISPDGNKNGQLTATFDNQPQLPFSRLHLQFKGGPRAPLVLPKRCGTYTTRAEMTGWSGKTVVSESSFAVTENCGGGFTPGFNAGTANPVAGESSPFVMRLTRDDADDDLSKISLDMPEGLLGRIADVNLCGEVDASNGTCPDSSKVGSVTVGAGAGSNPFYITNGRAYLTGPYKGGPFGLSIVVRAIAGPFDLGTVVVRSAILVDKHTARVSVLSDPLPTQLQGIPLDVRDVRVQIDRPGFWLNPTSCEQKTIGGVIEATTGARASVSSRFQVGNCGDLPLRPRMTLQVGGRGRTQRGRSTPLTATLRQTPGQSALSRVQVTLPSTINARLTVINDACTRAQYEAGNCEASRTGSATAVTPLLRDPLRGGVYFVRNGNPLPDLFVRLRGQVEFDLIGRITIPGSRFLRTTFDTVPDVPISTFKLSLVGGRNGSIGNAANLCSRRGRTARATLAFEGQNGKELDVQQRLKIRGCRARGRRGRGRRGARGSRRR